MFGLVLLLVLSAALPAEAQNWWDFKNKHIEESMSSASCTETITNKRINVSDTCKYKNSFIRATDDQVRAICGNGGTNVGSNTKKSIYKFRVVTCIRTNDKPCTYKGSLNYLYVTLKCENGRPVHYVREDFY